LNYKAELGGAKLDRGHRTCRIISHTV